MTDEVVAAARAMLRLAGTEEDALLATLAATAVGLAEAFCRQPLVGAAGVALASGWATLPAPVGHGVVLMTVHLFENRTADAAPPAAIAALWRPWRRMLL